MVAAVEFTTADRENLQQRDKEDALARFRERFRLPDGLVYMNGNSLGPLTHDASDRMAAAVSEEWGAELIRGWNSAGWYELPFRLGNKIGRLVGAAPGETVVSDSTSVNLFKATAAACSLRPGRTKIVSEAGNFPTDLYVLDGLRRFSNDRLTIDVRPRGEVLDAIDGDTATVVLTHVHYVTSEVFPMAEVTAAAHAAGALTVWDLSHSAGAIPTDLNGANADFAVGCGYKHLNGGPGAPAFIYAAERHHADMQQPLSGWFGHARPFEFSDEFVPAEGIRRLLCGTTGVLGGTALEAGVDLMLEADRAALQQKSQGLSSLFVELVGEFAAEFGLELRSPTQASERGAHVSYGHESGYSIMQNLIARNVIGDFRAPDNMRFGFSPLFMRYTDCYDAAAILHDILASRTWDEPQYKQKNAVT